MIARLGSDMLPMATAAVSGAFGPDVGPDVSLDPWDVTVIVPVKNVVAVDPNNDDMSWKVEPYGGSTTDAGLFVPVSGVPSARVAKMETVCSELARFDT